MARKDTRESLSSMGLPDVEPLRPDVYKVVLLNDDETTVDFVASVLMDLFGHTASKARMITLQIHEHGSGVAGVYPHEIAEAKVMETMARARRRGFPLRCRMEKVMA